MKTPSQVLAARVVLALSLFCCTPSEGANTLSPQRTGPNPAADLTPQPRIVGGEDAPAQPWMVSVGYIDTDGGKNYKRKCGGTLIAPTWVLTAAHCFDSGPDPLSNYVFVGGKDLRKKSTFIKARIEEVIKHPGFSFDADVEVNDIAVLRLATAVNNTPITLNANRSLDVPGGNVTPVAFGWGDLENRSDEGSDVLQSVELPLVSNKRCEAIYGIVPRNLRKTRLCAGGVEGKDTCQGDSGGPLVMGEGTNAVQIGVVAFGGICGAGPAIYTRVASYVPWLKGLDIPINTNSKPPKAS